MVVDQEASVNLKGDGFKRVRAALKALKAKGNPIYSTLFPIANTLLPYLNSSGVNPLPSQQLSDMDFDSDGFKISAGTSADCVCVHFEMLMYNVALFRLQC